MTPDDLDDEQLLYLVGQKDKALFEAGADIRRRQFEVPSELMRDFGYVGFVIAGSGKPAILGRIENTFQSIYRKQDLAMGSHIGVFMFRDVFARIGVPIVYGRASFNPFNFVELTDVQKRIINTEPDQIGVFVDQFIDVSDTHYGLSEVRQPYAQTELLTRFLGLSRLHLHAASAVLTGGYDFRGAVQSALLATELALKAGGAAHGLTEKKLKDDFGHRTDRLIAFLSERWPSLDADRISRTILLHPPYAPSRYSADEPDRTNVGHLVMGVQFIVSEIVRQVSRRSFRSSITPVHPRCYPL